MARRYGRSPRGERAYAQVPFGNWTRLSVLSALDSEGFLATMSIEAATDGDTFAAYLEQVLLPVLRERKPDAVLVMDMCGRPRGSKKNLQDRRGACRVLTCVRPLMRRSPAAGPYGSLRIGSNSIWRARGACPSSGFSNPVSRPLRHTLPLTFQRPTASRRRRLHGRDRSCVFLACVEQGPNDARHLVGERHPDQHRRLVAHQACQPGTRRGAVALS